METKKLFIIIEVVYVGFLLINFTSPVQAAYTCPVGCFNGTANV
jgi:hypothetical protein